jgi:hypothetical protein
MEETVAVEKSRQRAYKLQKHMLNHQMMAISKLKTGYDQIPAKLIKVERKELKEVIYELVLKNMGGSDQAT